ncbi:AraC family transcriptional regulator [Staphylococcus devriesei]|uniref:AraC family transcriptional regulator n=2 Tax=Staphylococcus devriesei TaxID=586733 RepID=A0A2T4L2X6_9STAP|nr:response regulator transcription factor [Staphylococcus devriesei]PTF05127.1 AraC family transcriptional regulator [Staphylococcus devriesei]PTF16105.1 AraC family transcriptional regulator [Staphylococcus devriesei]
MSNAYFHLLTKHEYKMTRCQDGIILLFPIEGQVKIQHFTKNITIENEIYIINNTDIFSIKDNNKTLMVYIASDWFRDEGFEFFDYKYSTNLLKSVNAIKKALLQLAINHLKDANVSEDAKHIRDIVNIIGKQGSMEKSIANNQYHFSYYGELSDVLEYINKNIDKRLTLKDISSHLFTSKSNLSAQFNQVLNMGFKTYVDTLKIATSFEQLLTTDYTISLISENLGFSNASSYSKTFKSYVGITPNDYRSCSKYEKDIDMDYESHIDDSLEKINHLIQSKHQYYQEKIEYNIYVDSQTEEVVEPYYLVLQINTIEEIKLLFLQDFARPLHRENSSLMYYLKVDMRDIKDQFTVYERQLMFEYIIKNNLNVIFRLEDLRLVNFLESNYEDVMDHFKANNITVNEGHELSLVFDLDEIDLKTIYRVILKIQHKTSRFSFGLEISKLLNDPVLFKTLESQIKRINFEFLYIDNAKLKMPYLIEKNERLLVKNILRYQNIREILQQIDLENKKIIFLNFENHNFINNQSSSLNNSAPLLIETIVKTARYFNGISFNFKHYTDLFNALYLFDENGFKSILGTMIDQLVSINTQPKLIKDNYIIVNDEDSYTVFLYDWRVLESESREVDYEQTDTHIDFKNADLKDQYLVKIQKIDDYNGNINHIISPSIREKYQWSTKFLRNMNDLTHPAYKIREHNFKKGPLKIKLNYNSFYIIKIYK